LADNPYHLIRKQPFSRDELASIVELCSQFVDDRYSNRRIARNCRQRLILGDYQNNQVGVTEAAV
jgi:hypothetical protein